MCARERPDVLVTHPPYDYLDIAVAERLRASGTRIVGYAFDDEIFAGNYGAETRAALGRIYDRYVTTREVPWATAPLPPLAEGSEGSEPKYDVALVGRAYARRVELVDALRAAGLDSASASVLVQSFEPTSLQRLRSSQGRPPAAEGEIAHELHAGLGERRGAELGTEQTK